MDPLRINDTTYEITLPPGDRVEIGDKDSADFKPCAKLNRWGTECSLVLTIPTNEKILPAIQNQKILWQGRDYGAEFFAGTDGFKFNIILPEKPGTNIFPLDFGSDNLKFCYQPPLTEEFKEGWSEEFQRDILVTDTQVTDLDGNVLVNRPENVVGSYAVYHASKGNMHAGEAEAEKYKTGKAFHWYRPLIYDNAGNRCWGILNVGQGIRTVTIPQSFLDNAVYPVTIDDDFGYTIKGSSDWTIYNSIKGLVSTGAAGTANTMSTWLKGTAGQGATGKCAIYILDTLALFDTSTEYGEEITPNYPANPVAMDLNDLTISAIDYLLCVWGGQGSSAIYVPYDTGDTPTQGRFKSQTYDGWPDPLSSLSSVQRKISLYCTYTPSGGGATEKSDSDSGAGADARASANPVAAISGAESGSGADSLPARDIALPEAGSGVDALVSLQTPAAKTSSDAGSGFDAFVSLQIPQPKTSSDAGYGVEAMLAYSAVLAGGDSGSGVEAFIARLLAAAEAGYGAEASEIGGGGLLKHLFASELGEGADGLTAKIEIPNKGGGMKLWT